MTALSSSVVMERWPCHVNHCWNPVANTQIRGSNAAYLFCPLTSCRYQNVWMYVIHEMENAVDACNNGGETPSLFGFCPPNLSPARRVNCEHGAQKKEVKRFCFKRHTYIIRRVSYSIVHPLSCACSSSPRTCASRALYATPLTTRPSFLLSSCTSCVLELCRLRRC